MHLLSLPDRFELPAKDPLMTGSASEFLTVNELNQLKVIQIVVDRRLTTHLTAELLGISDRHCRYLLQRYRTDGPLGMADRRRGKPSNYQLPAGIADRVVQIIRERYSNFGPTLACERLTELHGVVLSKETVCKLMTRSDLDPAQAARP